MLLHHRLAVLRYHRADPHAAAWQAAGHTVDTIRDLAAGPERERIEAETNRGPAGRTRLSTPLRGLGWCPG